MDAPLLARLKQRKLVQWALAYLAGAWLVLQVADGLGDAFSWPPAILRCLWVALGFGLPIALILAWYHGEKGAQRVGTLELLLLSGVLVLAGTAVAFVGERAPAAEAAPAGAPAALFASAPAEHSIAVLPFTSMSPDEENEYFASGIHDDVLTSLAKLSGLKVISRTSVMQYRGTTKTIQQIGAELGAAHLLEGSVRRSGGRVRIVAQLIDARNGYHLWAETYDRDLEDIFALQSEIAERIAISMRAKLSPGDQQHLAEAGSRPADPEAYEAYLRGRHLGVFRWAEAKREYERAIGLDPDFAPAYAALADGYHVAAFYGLVSSVEAYEKMSRYALQALEKDAREPLAHAALGLVRLHRDFDWPAAERHFRRALQLNPSHAGLRHSYAHYLMAMGRMEESAAESAWAAELAPRSPALLACSGWHGLTDHREEHAAEQALRALRIQPDFFWPEMVLGWAYEQEGKYPEAIEAFRDAVHHSGESSFALAALGHALARSGHRQQARDILAELERRSRDGYVSAFDFATLHAGLGEIDRAFEWLERAYNERSLFLIKNIGWDPRLDPLRSDPRFARLVRRIGLPQPGPTAPARS